MKTIRSELNVFIDTDETLILPYRSGDFDTIKIKMPGNDFFTEKSVHRTHVRQLKALKERGYKVFVWSHNGYNHSENVVRALGLEDYVDFCLSKPIKTIDDKSDFASIVGMLFYMEDKE